MYNEKMVLRYGMCIWTIRVLNRLLSAQQLRLALSSVKYRLLDISFTIMFQLMGTVYLNYPGDVSINVL